MAVDTQHEDYTNSVATWQFCRDMIAGDDAVKAKKETYVPRLSEQDDTQYLAMLNRPVYEGYTSRTLDGMTGLIFSKAPAVEAPESLKLSFDNIDLAGKTLTDLAQDTVEDVFATDRVGLLVDRASVDTKGMTNGEVEALKLRPFIKAYPTESIINWKYDSINNQQVLSLVVLKESKEKWSDEFTSEKETIYRVLSLEKGIYRVRIFENQTKGEGKNAVTQWIATSDIYPKMNNAPMTEIPFIGITSTSLGLDVKKPPLYDMAKVNLTHFKTNVEYYHGMHFTALPTPYMTGYQSDDDEEIKIGSTSILTLSDPSATLGYLEFSGDGLGTLEREKTNQKETMVVLGSNMLQSDKKTAEAENTVAMRNAGQNASIVSVADTVSRGIELALNIANKWNSSLEKVTYKLNTDYNLIKLDAQSLTAYVQAWLSGAMSHEELFLNLQKGELIKESKTFEEHQTQIEEETPNLSEPPATTTPNEAKDKSTLQTIREKMGL